jgi:hypothetical protein
MTEGEGGNDEITFQPNFKALDYKISPFGRNDRKGGGMTFPSVMTQLLLSK